MKEKIEEKKRYFFLMEDFLTSDGKKVGKGTRVRLEDEWATIFCHSHGKIEAGALVSVNGDNIHPFEVPLSVLNLFPPDK